MSEEYLGINDLRIWLKLGCSREEQHFAQPIDVNIKIFFKQTTNAVMSDIPSQTICYSEIVDAIEKYIDKKQPIQLIEHVAYNIFIAIEESINKLYDKEIIEKIDYIKIIAKKLRSPVKSINGYVEFQYTNILNSQKK